MISDSFEFTYYHHKCCGKTIKIRTQTGSFSRALLAEHVRGRKGLLIVEIGVFGGAQLLYLAQRFPYCGHRLVGIDPWEDIEVFNGTPASEIDDQRLVEERRAAFRDNRTQLETAIAECGYDIRLLKGTSSQYCDAFADASIDLLHLDGDHGQASVTEDLEKYFPKLAQGGVIIGDDWRLPAVRVAARAFAKSKNLTILVAEDPRSQKPSNKFLIQKRP